MLSTKRPRGAIVSAVASAAAFLLMAAPAGAATDVYPAGGGTFANNLQGWQVTEESCNLPVICTVAGAHDSGEGNPPGSATAETTVILGLVNLISSTVVFESPQFTVARDGVATLRLDRQFVPSQVAVPNATYTVTLKDITGGTEQTVHAEALTAASPTFGAQQASADVTAGHSYALEVEAETAATVELGLLGGANLRFDNVALSVESSGGGGGGGGGGGDDGGSGKGGGGDRSSSRSDGSSSLSDKRLLSLVRGAVAGPAVLRGRRLFVKVSCPRRVGGACRIVAQGMLNRRRPATTKRATRVGRGKTRRIVLKVKPRARRKVAKRKRLLVREKIRARGAKATVYRRRGLIRR